MNSCPKCQSDQTQSFVAAHKTGSTKAMQPPKQDSYAGSGCAFIFIAVFIFNVVGAALGLLITRILGREISDLTSWIIGLSVGAIVAVAFMILARKNADNQKVKGEAIYKAAMIKWNHSWICLKCGNAFIVR